MHLPWISKQTAIISLYIINLSVFITEAESVYCAVRTGSLKERDTNFDILLTVHLNIFILILTNLMH